MLHAVLCVFILIRGMSEKKYCFAAVSILAMLHTMSVALNTYDNIVFKSILQTAEIACLIAMVTVLIYCSWREKRKLGIILAVFAGVACVLRMIRSMVYDMHVNAAIQPGTDAAAVIGALNDRYNLLNGIISFCILVVLACVAWRLRKK